MSRRTGWRTRRRMADSADSADNADNIAVEAEREPTTMPSWARRGVYGAGGILLAAGIGMSGFFLSQLAESFGIAAPYSFLLPAALDAGAVVGVLMWVTGTGEIALFGRRLARLLFGLSILGNALERALTFTTAPAGATGIAAVLARTRALLDQLAGWDDPSVAGATWFLLAVSVGIGIVFPVLAYQMAHATILARRSTDIPAHPGRDPNPVGLPGALSPQQDEPAAPVAPAVAVPTDVGGPPAPRTLAVPQPAEAPRSPARAAAGARSSIAPRTSAATRNSAAKRTGAATRTGAPTRARAGTSTEPDTAPLPVVPARSDRVAQPYVHDGRDLEPDTPQWQDRFDRLPGTSKQAKLAHWLACEWETGAEPNLATVADRVVDGRRVAQRAKKELAERGILPPSQRARDSAADLVPAG